MPGNNIRRLLGHFLGKNACIARCMSCAKWSEPGTLKCISLEAGLNFTPRI